MKNIIKFTAILSVFCLLTVNCSYAVNIKDYKDIILSTKKMSKLANKNKLDELSKYYSDNYISFDGYNRKEIMEIYKIANSLYPNVKSREKITKIKTKDDLVTVYLNETSKANMEVTGENAMYAPDEKIDGRMISKSKYSMTFKKENGKWVVVKDEIFDETTDIRYGEAIKSKFEMKTPDKIKEGEEYTVKTTLKMPENRYVVGSIGHDKIIFPPEKYFDPYRKIDETGILERVMIANKEGRNEYANSTFAFVAPFLNKKNNERIETKMAVSGMGIYVKRINLAKEDAK